MSQSARRPVPRPTVVRQLRDLGVAAGGVLLVHTSFRAVGPVAGGPAGLVAALREAVGAEGTLVMPSWSGEDDVPFDPTRSEAAASLGVVARAFWREPGVLRSPHNHAFAAAGPWAQHILADPLPLPPHRPESPVGRVHELDGWVLLLGVDHDADTTIHLAEVVAGVPYGVPKHVTILREGRPHRVDYMENDHCCARFRLMDEWLRGAGLQAEGPVGHGRARLARSRDVVGMAVERLVRNPLLFLHPADEGCAECDEARASAGVDARPGT